MSDLFGDYMRDLQTLKQQHLQNVRDTVTANPGNPWLGYQEGFSFVFRIIRRSTHLFAQAALEVGNVLDVIIDNGIPQWFAGLSFQSMLETLSWVFFFMSPTGIIAFNVLFFVTLGSDVTVASAALTVASFLNLFHLVYTLGESLITDLINRVWWLVESPWNLFGRPLKAPVDLIDAVVTYILAIVLHFYVEALNPVLG